MQSVLRSGSRLGLRAARGITWQLQKSRALQGPGGSAHLVRQAGLRRSGHTPAGEWRHGCDLGLSAPCSIVFRPSVLLVPA